MPTVPVSATGLQLISESDTGIGVLASSYKLGHPLQKWGNHILGVRQGGPVIFQTYDKSQSEDVSAGVFNYKIYVHNNVLGYDFTAVVFPSSALGTLTVQVGSGAAASADRGDFGGVGIIELRAYPTDAERGTYVDIVVTAVNLDLWSLSVVPSIRTTLSPDIRSDICIVPNSTVTPEGGLDPGKYIHSGGPTNAGTYDMQDMYEQLILGVAEERRVLYSWANPAGTVFITGVAWTAFFEGSVNPRQPQFTSDASFDARVYFYTIADFKGNGSQYQVRVITDTETVTSGALVNDGDYAWNFLDIKILQNAEGDSLVIEALTDNAIATVAIRGYCVQRIVV